MSLLSSIRSVFSELSLFGFPLLRKKKATHSILDWPPLEAKIKNSEIPPTAPIPAQNHSTGLSAPFQLNSKPNSSPQGTLQSSESKKVSHPDSEIMLPGPAMDIFEARAECRTSKLTLTRGRERRVLISNSPFGGLVKNSALPSPGQGQFVSPAFRSGFENVHGGSRQHDLQVRMASFLRFRAL